ncbi:DUF2892 domain-containing protein [Marinifilum caeruleilacunae]|uniref:DUF2892 domain-containing protein n=1 Tax=Marinifilum caeruleilacunae TaxID=2499076 RepID=A0ABX1WR37_9BACT|nr:DUF2892 domain-containing protein [Marinifilum caeruleilacunae]NOU58462.1 DUF2892 domain-containing protein [Marinifilum caeruleilacunae]
MLTNIIRLIIAGILLLGSIFLFIKSFVGLGIVAVLLSGLFVLFHFKNEKNLLAFYFLRKNKFQSAGKVLNGVKRPERMIKGQEAYYYYLSGLISSQEHNNSQAEKQFKKALNTGLRMKTDKAVANLNLSGIYLSRRNKKLSKYYLQEAKSLDKQKMLSAQIKEVEHMMKRI